MEENYGIDIDHAHKRAVELIPEEFFWSCIDELAPFGSDEGDTALAEYRDWRKANPGLPTIDCLKWTIENVGEMAPEAYNEQLLSKDKIKAQVEDPAFDDQQYIFTLDISVIATGFAQLVDEGTIDAANKKIIEIAIDRQIIWSQVGAWDHATGYISNLEVLKRVLQQA